MNEQPVVSSEVTSSQSKGWFESVKSTFNIENLSEKLKESKPLIMQIFIFGAIGFFTGFIVKRLSNFILWLIILFVALFVLIQTNLVELNWLRVNELFGIDQTTATTEQLPLMIWHWIRANIFPVLSFIVGFVFGLKIA